MTVSVYGAGAFGTSLAIALARDGTPVRLWGRDKDAIVEMERTRKSNRRLPGHLLPDSLTVTYSMDEDRSDVALLAIPAQEIGGFLSSMPHVPSHIVACCKGIDRKTGLGPVGTIEAKFPDVQAGMLTGPSFASDIALGLPTALVLASRHEASGADLQRILTRPALRLYRTTDVAGAELGGALKNVVALAAGIAIGAGLGDSARASVIARGFSEMVRLALAKGARSETLHGLSGLGDLVLTCTSEKSRNFSAGIALGQGKTALANTVEGIATAGAVRVASQDLGLELPLMESVAKVVAGELDISAAIATLLARPVGKE